MRALCLSSCFVTHYRHFARPARMRALCLFRCFGTPLRGEGLRPLLLLAGGEAGDIAGATAVASSFGAIRAPLPRAALRNMTGSVRLHRPAVQPFGTAQTSPTPRRVSSDQHVPRQRKHLAVANPRPDHAAGG